MEEKDKKSIIEALLFVSGEPIMLSTIKSIIEIPEPEIKKIIEELQNEYKERSSGILIIEIAQGFQMVTKPDYSHWISKLKKTSVSSKLSIQSLETLSIIAYKQPIIKAEIEQLRGVNSDGVIKTLLERRLIKIIGRKEAPGRPLLYGTTREFLQYFGLKDLTELPILKEFSREEV